MIGKQVWISSGFLPDHLLPFEGKLGSIVEEILDSNAYNWLVSFSDGTSEVFSILDFEYLDDELDGEEFLLE